MFAIGLLSVDENRSPEYAESMEDLHTITTDYVEPEDLNIRGKKLLADVESRVVGAGNMTHYAFVSGVKYKPAACSNPGDKCILGVFAPSEFDGAEYCWCTGPVVFVTANYTGKLALTSSGNVYFLGRASESTEEEIIKMLPENFKAKFPFM